MRYLLRTTAALTALLCCITSSAQQADNRLTPVGELLVSKIPRPSPTPQELDTPCVKGDAKRLIAEVEPMAQFLSSSGQLPAFMLERIPD